MASTHHNSLILLIRGSLVQVQQGEQVLKYKSYRIIFYNSFLLGCFQAFEKG